MLHWHSIQASTAPTPSFRPTACKRLCRQNEDEGEELTPWGEQEAWEAHQVAQASMKTGAQDKRGKQAEYELVLPDAVEFIAAQAIKGTLVSLPLWCL